MGAHCGLARYRRTCPRVEHRESLRRLALAAASEPRSRPEGYRHFAASRGCSNRWLDRRSCVSRIYAWTDRAPLRTSYRHSDHRHNVCAGPPRLHSNSVALLCCLTLLPYYVAVTALYGVVTSLTNSILPAIILHTLGNTYSNLDLLLHGRAEWQAASRTADVGGPDTLLRIVALIVVTLVMWLAFIKLSGSVRASIAAADQPKFISITDYFLGSEIRELPPERVANASKCRRQPNSRTTS